MTASIPLGCGGVNADDGGKPRLFAFRFARNQWRYFGLLLGTAMGALRGVEAAAFLRYYGRGHIGSIRGIATSIGLASTALGPIYFAVGYTMTGSYVAPSIVAAFFRWRSPCRQFL